MKLSSNSVGMLFFAALATALFVFMVLRPAADGNAMNLGVPLDNTIAVETTPEETKTEFAAESDTNPTETTEASTEEKPAEAPATTEVTKPSIEADEGTEADPEETKTTN